MTETQTRRQNQRKVILRSPSAYKYNNTHRKTQFDNSMNNEEQLQDQKVHNSLSRMSRFVRKGGDQGWTRSPYKVKQLRYTRHIMNLISKGKASEAGEVFELMKKAGVKPETAVYNTLIAGYGRQGDAKESFHLFNQVSVLLYLVSLQCCMLIHIMSEYRIIVMGQLLCLVVDVL